MGAEPQELVTIVPVLREEWDNDPPSLARLYQRAKEAMEQEGTVVGETTHTVHYEAVIDGHRLFEEFEGISLPEMVFVRFRAMAIPHKEIIHG